MNENDERIVKNASAGGVEAFDDLVRQYLPLVFSYVFRLTGDKMLAEDIAQETFIRVWKQLRSFEIDRPFKPWLMRIAHNCTLDILRRKKPAAFSSLTLPMQTVLETLPDQAASLPHLVEKAATTETVLKILAGLKPTEREILTLHYMEELSVREIAGVLFLPQETVRSRLRRARQAFRRKFEPDLASTGVLGSKSASYGQQRPQATSQVAPSPGST